MNLPSWKTIKKSLLRALWAGLLGAASAFVILPVNLEEPKKYILVLSLSLLTGFLMGIQKFVSGYIKYDGLLEKKR